MKKDIQVFINNESINVTPGSSVLQACELANIEIPRFCFHERLLIAGNCRMCLVEIEKSPKPVASCAMPVAPGMRVFTDTPLVKKAREGVLEFLLLNHPLDCPICDQGGECDLQDQTYMYASDRSRFFEKKRSVEDHYYGVLIKTVMTRCIHCTRCVRFATEVAGVPVLGSTLRGRSTEIGSYVEKVFDSELSGNIIDLCPVGALTSKPYAFTSRPWELRSVNSVDVFDGLGSNLRIDFYGNQIRRILPRLNEEINEEWISDKVRFSYDGLNRQRITSPLIKKNNKLVKSSWESVFNIIKKKLSENILGSNIVGLINPEYDLTSALSFKKFLLSLGAKHIGFPYKHGDFNNDLISDYSFNSQIKNIENTDLCLLIGINTRKEAAVLNSRLYKKYLEGSLEVAYIGEAQNFTFPAEHLGSSYKSIIELLEGRSLFIRKLMKAKNPMIIVGSHVFSNKFGKTLITSLKNILKTLKLKNNIINILHDNPNITGLLNLGLKPINFNDLTDIKVLFTLGCSLNDVNKLKERNKNLFIICQDFQGSDLASISDVVLPNASFVEKTSYYTNTENKVQEAQKAVPLVGEAKLDWQIYNALSYYLNKEGIFSSRKVFYSSIESQMPWMNNNFNLDINDSINIDLNRKLNKSLSVIGSKISDFYLTNSVTNYSKVMLKCSKEMRKTTNFVVK